MGHPRQDGVGGTLAFVVFPWRYRVCSIAWTHWGICFLGYKDSIEQCNQCWVWFLGSKDIFMPLPRSNHFPGRWKKAPVSFCGGCWWKHHFVRVFHSANALSSLCKGCRVWFSQVGCEGRTGSLNPANNEKKRKNKTLLTNVWMSQDGNRNWLE